MWDYQVEVYHHENCMFNNSDIIKLYSYWVKFAILLFIFLSSFQQYFDNLFSEIYNYS